MFWLEWKDVAEVWTGLGEDALHIYAALAVQLLAAALSRRSIAHPLPLAAVLAVQTANELLDLAYGSETVQAWQIEGGIHDMWNTMLAPTLLFLVARFAPRLLTGGRKRR
jgi:hypothetical protein